jgi:uncharacterized membrane protein YraQ (UPF0718 family)
MKNNPSFIQVLKKSAVGIYYVSPMILAVLGLSALLISFVTPEQAKSLFTGNGFTDTIYGTISGSIMMGNAMISYILGGELIKMNISLYAITAFLLAWVSLGYVQIPLEISYFGKRFTYTRNILAIVFTLIISVLIVITYEAVR